MASKDDAGISLTARPFSVDSKLLATGCEVPAEKIAESPAIVGSKVSVFRHVEIFEIIKSTHTGIKGFDVDVNAFGGCFAYNENRFDLLLSAL